MRYTNFGSYDAGGAVVVPRNEVGRDAHLVKSGDCNLGLGFDGIRQGKVANHRIRVGGKHHGLGIPLQGLDFFDEGRIHGNILLRQAGEVTNDKRLSVKHRDDAPTLPVLNVGRRLHTPRHATPGVGTDGGTQGVLAAELRAGAVGPKPVLGKVGVGEKSVGLDGRLAQGEGAGLIKYAAVDEVGVLQRHSTLDQHPKGGSQAGTGHHGSRRRQPERARARNDDDGDGVEQREEERVRPRGNGSRGQKVERAEDVPHHKGQARKEHHHGDEDARNVVRKGLDGGLAELRLLDQVDDAGEARGGADLRDAHHDLPALVHGAPHHGVAHRLGDRHGLPRQEGLVHRRGTDGNGAVGGHTLPGTDDEGIPDLQQTSVHDLLVDDGARVVQLHHRRGLRAQGHELLQGLARAPLGHGLEVLAQKDECDEHNRHVKENGDVVRGAELPHYDGHARVCVRHAGGQAHQYVHVGGSVAQGFVRTRVEATADPELHGGGEQEHEEGHEGEVRHDLVHHDPGRHGEAPHEHEE
mmetsp:Transcript_20189/g.56810  ORF Transcript_20189/g.56810 Transcript_20189/m.56810 type:complete len:524 (-) Transcript_20189:474-2045(-)